MPLMLKLEERYEIFKFRVKNRAAKEPFWDEFNILDPDKTSHCMCVRHLPKFRENMLKEMELSLLASSTLSPGLQIGMTLLLCLLALATGFMAIYGHAIAFLCFFNIPLLAASLLFIYKKIEDMSWTLVSIDEAIFKFKKLHKQLEALLEFEEHLEDAKDSDTPPTQITLDTVEITIQVICHMMQERYLLANRIFRWI